MLYLGGKTALEKIVIVQYMCSMCCMITYGMRRPQNVYCFQNECDTQTDTRAHTRSLLIDSMEETHTDLMLFKRFMLKECVSYTVNLISRCLDITRVHGSIKFPHHLEWELGMTARVRAWKYSGLILLVTSRSWFHIVHFCPYFVAF